MSPLYLSAQGLQFYREELRFELKDHYFLVTGIYDFCNTGASEIKEFLFYPFPNGNKYGKIDSVNIINMKDTKQGII
ncbi:MAG: hypothetical protein R6V32_03630, partial [Bacteroidales bacterium]